MGLKEELKEYIIEYGVTQKHIAKKTNMSTALMSHYLNGEKNISEKKEEAIRIFLDNVKNH